MSLNSFSVSDSQLSFSPSVLPAQDMGWFTRAIFFRFSFSMSVEIELSKFLGFTDSPQFPVPQTRVILLNKGLIHKSCGQTSKFQAKQTQSIQYKPVLDNGTSK